MHFATSGQDLLDSFALVTYLPDPLCSFLDNLRRELAPGCAPHAHVTILPPRPLAVTPEEAVAAMRSRISDFSAFEIKAGEVLIFAGSDVVYLSIKEGRPELLQMHRALNVGPLKHEGPYPYHPHITLAQDLTPQQSIELAAVAQRRWAEYSGPRVFSAEKLVFVQNTARHGWTDLAHFQLAPAPSIRR